MLQTGTGAVSRYKFDRSQKTVTVQDFNLGQMRVSGCKNHYKFILSAGAKVEERSDETPPCGAKSVTNNLPILSVLAQVLLFSIVEVNLNELSD